MSITIQTEKSNAQNKCSVQNKNNEPNAEFQEVFASKPDNLNEYEENCPEIEELEMRIEKNEEKLRKLKLLIKKEGIFTCKDRTKYIALTESEDMLTVKQTLGLTFVITTGLFCYQFLFPKKIRQSVMPKLAKLGLISGIGCCLIGAYETIKSKQVYTIEPGETLYTQEIKNTEKLKQELITEYKKTCQKIIDYKKELSQLKKNLSDKEHTDNGI